MFKIHIRFKRSCKEPTIIIQITEKSHPKDELVVILINSSNKIVVKSE